MFYRGLKVGVVYKEHRWAEKWFKEFISKIDKSCVKKYILSHSDIAVILKDGTIIKAVSATGNSRGSRFDKIFVQPGVDKDVIDHVIRPMILPTIINEYE